VIEPRGVPLDRWLNCVAQGWESEDAISPSPMKCIMICLPDLCSGVNLDGALRGMFSQSNVDCGNDSPQTTYLDAGADCEENIVRLFATSGGPKDLHRGRIFPVAFSQCIDGVGEGRGLPFSDRQCGISPLLAEVSRSSRSPRLGRRYGMVSLTVRSDGWRKFLPTSGQQFSNLRSDTLRPSSLHPRVNGTGANAGSNQSVDLIQIRSMNVGWDLFVDGAPY